MAKRKQRLKNKSLARNPKYEHLQFAALSAAQAAAATATLRHDWADERMDSDARKGCTPSLCNASAVVQQDRYASCSRACLDWFRKHAQDPPGTEMGEPLPGGGGAVVVIMVRGEEFRSFGYVSKSVQQYRTSCSAEPTALLQQQLASESIMHMIAAPLARRGNRVHLLASSSCAGGATASLLGEWYRGAMSAACATDEEKERVEITIRALSSSTQCENVNGSFRAFDGLLSALPAGDQPALFLHMRHDILWLQPITSWPARWGSFSVATRCEKTNNWKLNGKDCMADMFYSFPGNGVKGAYEAASAVLTNCFCESGRNAHRCGPALRELASTRLGTKLEYAFDMRPELMREENPWFLFANSDRSGATPLQLQARRLGFPRDPAVSRCGVVGD